jgi:hypothetical protein
MPAIPPVDATHRYPVTIRDFVKYMDQPQDGTKVFVTQNPDGTTTTTDLTLDAAIVTKDLHTEIISMEQTIGAPPFLVPKTISLSGSIQWLFANKAWGRVDARGAITPPPVKLTTGPGDRTGSAPQSPPMHTHEHRTTTKLTADDHPQYMRVDGTRAFTAPVTAPAATAANDLINLSQAKNAGLTATQVSSIIQQTLAAQKLVPGEHNITGPDSRRWKMAGGVAQGYTDGNGNLWVDLTPARFAGILSFMWMKMPFPGGSMLGWYAYQYMEDQLILQALSNEGAMVQFIEDIRVDRSALVCMCWMALGI